MIDCKRVLREVESYLDGELDPAELREIRAHLDDCPPCMTRADFQRRLRSLIARSCSGREVPPSLRGQIDRILAEEAGSGD